VRPISTVIGAALAAASSPHLSTPALIERETRRGSIDRTRGSLLLAYAFGRPEKLPGAYRSDVPWEGTAPLLELQRAQRAMPPGPARSEIAEILSGETGPGSCGPHSGGSLPSSTTTPHFYVEYGSVGGGLTVGSYTAALETSWTTEVDTFGWAAPPVLPANPPPGNRYHVRLDALPMGLYGYVTVSGAHAGLVGNNPSSAWDDTDSYATCMVLRNDYSGFLSAPQASLDATVAHEFNHSIQFGYGALHGSNRPDYAFVEGGATWMEDEVFDTSNDNYHFLWPAFAESMGDYDGSFFAYETWITLRGLTERYGTGMGDGSEQIMQDFWEETSKNTGDNLTALQTALANRGTNLADAYHAYAIAAKFNRACGSGFIYPYCLEEGPGYVAANDATTVHGTIASLGGSPFSGSIEDNYALNWVQLPTGGGTFDTTLTNTDGSGGMLRGSVVCDTGTGFSIHAFPSVVGAGASSLIAQLNPAGCTEAVAVITNQAQTAANPSTSVARSYQLATSVASTSATLSVVKVGSGFGTVTSTPAGIQCGSDCAETYAGGTLVELAAAASAGSTFAGWSGACTGTGPCSVTMDSAKSVAATFAGSHTLSVERWGSGTGTVTSDVAGINCGDDCSETYPFGTVVRLTASASSGSSFGGWSGKGCIVEGGTCTVNVNWTKSVKARFTDATAPISPLIDGSNLAKPFQTSKSFDLSWGVPEIAQYDVRYRSAPHGAAFGGFVVWQSGTSGTSAVFSGSPGRAYCFSARARDADLNTSEYGTERCTAIPAASTALKHRGPWAKKKAGGYFLGAFSVTSTKGANLELANVHAKRLALVATKCPRCGTIKVFFRNKLLRRIRLGAGSTRKKQIVDLAVFNTVRSGRLRVVVMSSGRPVKIEGLGVSAV
jgi:hypothetical protein